MCLGLGVTVVAAAISGFVRLRALMRGRWAELGVYELLPGSRWAWPLGALAVAFQPMFGFIAGGVQVDNALDLCTAGLMLAIAITLRRGLTARRGLAVGLCSRAR